MNFILGARGRLGRALVSLLPTDSTIPLERAVYERWTGAGTAGDVARFFEQFASTPIRVFVAAGIIDPKRSAEDHQQVNVTLPQNLLEGAGRHGARILTFGTIMEEVVGRSTGNQYFNSKLRISDAVQDAAGRGTNALHVRIHTLYGGGAPERFMFLGQLLEALRQGEVFRMSVGTQLREYHHVEDDAKAVSILANSDARGAINVSHGDPVRLRDLATFVCSRLASHGGLEVGALASSPVENLDRTFERPEQLNGLHFRETMTSVLDYMKSHMVAS